MYNHYLASIFHRIRNSNFRKCSTFLKHGALTNTLSAKKSERYGKFPSLVVFWKSIFKIVTLREISEFSSFLALNFQKS